MASCVCFLKYGHHNFGPDYTRPGVWHCLSCGAPDTVAIATEQEYNEAWRNGTEKNFYEMHKDLLVPQALAPILNNPLAKVNNILIPE